MENQNNPRHQASVFNEITEGVKITPPTPIKNFLIENGFTQESPNWAPCFNNLNSIKNLDEENFEKIFKSNLTDINKCLSKELVIPEFEEFRNSISKIFEETKEEKDGLLASYIPQLARVDPEYFGLSIYSIDGQRLNLGDHKIDFCLQSCFQPLLYAIVLEVLGEKEVHKFVDREPSGQTYYSMILNQKSIPYNPMMNSGAIMLSYLLGKDKDPSDRFDKINTWVKKATGGIKPGFSNSVYISECKTADTNHALAHLMKSKGKIPEDANIKDFLEFYFQCCSIEMDCQGLATIASTFANGGVCPTTQERIFSSSTTRSVLSLMYSCGMNDDSGQFSFSIGLPAKSGVGGGLMVVVPNLCGIAIYSPKLDKAGNSVRGVEFCKRLIKRFKLHNFDNMINFNETERIDPTRSKKMKYQQTLTEFFYYCKENDINAVKRLIKGGIDIDICDYDKRTALHIAASEGFYDLVAYLLKKGVNPNVKDRWGATPLDNAKSYKYDKIKELLEKL